MSTITFVTTETTFVSRTNAFLVGTLIRIGDVSESIVILSLIFCTLKKAFYHMKRKFASNVTFYEDNSRSHIMSPHN